jgi:nucleoside-diphosphate-sugar epimerase
LLPLLSIRFLLHRYLVSQSDCTQCPLPPPTATFSSSLVPLRSSPPPPFLLNSPSLNDHRPQSGATVVIHTASPIHGLGPAIYEKVNVVGTSTVIASCVAHGIRKLVYTSSAGVIYDGEEHVVDVDERLDFPEIPMDAYNETKARAEALVLGANGREGLKTCALRPAGIFG